MNDACVDMSSWCRAIDHHTSAMMAQGYAVVTWPSGRRTLEMYGATAIASEREITEANGDLLESRAANLALTLEDYRQRTLARGYWMRTRHGRRKPRAVVSVAWMKPSAYVGPKPIIGGLLP